MFFFAATLYNTFLILIQSLQKPNTIAVIAHYGPCWLLNASLLGPTFLAEYNNTRNTDFRQFYPSEDNANLVVVIVRSVLCTTRFKTTTKAQTLCAKWERELQHRCSEAEL
jgi:hypothetical protein